MILHCCSKNNSDKKVRIKCMPWYISVIKSKILLVKKTYIYIYIYMYHLHFILFSMWLFRCVFFFLFRMKGNQVSAIDIKRFFSLFWSILYGWFCVLINTMWVVLRFPLIGLGKRTIKPCIIKFILPEEVK